MMAVAAAACHYFLPALWPVLAGGHHSPPVTMLWTLVTSEEWQQQCSPVISPCLDTGVIGCDQVCSTVTIHDDNTLLRVGDIAEEVPEPGGGLGHLFALLQHHCLGGGHPGEQSCKADTNTKYCSGWVDWWWSQWQLGTSLGKLWSLLLVHRKVRERDPSNIFVSFLKNIFVVSECGGGVTKVSDISVEATISTVFAGLSLLASCLSVLTTVLFCKYR